MTVDAESWIAAFEEYFGGAHRMLFIRSVGVGIRIDLIERKSAADLTWLFRLSDSPSAAAEQVREGLAASNS